MATSVIKNTMNLLWENPSPTSAFAAGDVALSSSDYDLYLVLETDATTSYVRASSVSPKGLGGVCNWCLNDNNKVATSYRVHSFVDDTTIRFNDCYYSTITATTVTNAYLIPYQIYGIKLH